MFVNSNALGAVFVVSERTAGAALSDKKVWDCCYCNDEILSKSERLIILADTLLIIGVLHGQNSDD